MPDSAAVIFTPRGRTLTSLNTPCLLLDRRRLNANVQRMRDRAERLGVTLRPHLKTAKSIDVARCMMSTPTGPATVSTIREAEYFAANGVTDMIYAVGIAPSKLPRVQEIRRCGAELAVILDSIEQADAIIASQWTSDGAIPALIEVDVDGHRGGIASADAATLIDIAHRLSRVGALRGVLAHAGGSYHQTDPRRLEVAAEHERDVAVAAALLLRSEGFACPVVSVGSSPTALSAKDLTGVTELRAGVFAFGDLFQAGVGTTAFDDLALSVLATVIGHNHAKDWIIIDAGWAALSSDRSTARQKIDQGFGVVCDISGRPYPDLIVEKVSQEHGVIRRRLDSDVVMAKLPIGSRVRILPNHACATAMQHDRYHVLDEDDRVSVTWPRVSGW